MSVLLKIIVDLKQIVKESKRLIEPLNIYILWKKYKRIKMRIILFLVLVLLILMIFAVSENLLSKKNKVLITALLAFVGILGYAFSLNEQSTQTKRAELLNAFEQGKTLNCGSVDVNSSDFAFEYGTSSFVAKKDNKNKAGVIISISNCELKAQ